ncbi:MAG TPA: universal stress protein [Candidatus Acidoferrales bacterium]|jgi:nucleotide-binding universal stress UspA family protein|nr:universal stress protein [Candidatus Acidoferrales bacterium]
MAISDAIRFERILFATDFTAASIKALPYAEAMTRRFGATLFVAHIIPPEQYGSVPVEQRDAALSAMRQEAQQRIQAMMATANFEAIPYQILVVHGDVLPVLSSIAEERNVDLLVAGTRGRHGLQKLVSGSLAEEVYIEAARPVLLVGPEVTAAPESEWHIERILCIPDLESESGGALRYAYALAAAYSAKLYLLHLVDNPWAEPLSTRMPHEAFFRMRLLEKGWPDKQDGIEPEFLVEFGSTETQALAMARKHDIQMIITSVRSAGHPDLAAHLPGPLAYNIVIHAQCPVLVVHDSWGATSDRKSTGKTA